MTVNYELLQKVARMNTQISENYGKPVKLSMLATWAELTLAIANAMVDDSNMFAPHGNDGASIQRNGIYDSLKTKG